MEHRHEFPDENDGACSCGKTAQQVSDESTQALMKVRMDSGHEQLKHTAAEMNGIDNSWNLLHIATQVLPSMLTVAMHERPVPADEYGIAWHFDRAAQLSLRAADALLKEWRKSQGDDYGD